MSHELKVVITGCPIELYRLEPVVVLAYNMYNVAYSEWVIGFCLFKTFPQARIPNQCLMKFNGKQLGEKEMP